MINVEGQTPEDNYVQAVKVEGILFKSLHTSRYYLKCNENKIRMYRLMKQTICLQGESYKLSLDVKQDRFFP